MLPKSACRRSPPRSLLPRSSLKPNRNIRQWAQPHGNSPYFCGFSCVLPWLTLRSTVILIQENLMWNIDIYWCIYNICVFRISWSLIQSLWRFSNSLRNFAALFIVFLIGLDRNLYFAPYPPYEDDMKSYLSNLALLTAAVRIENYFLIIKHAFEIILCLCAP